MGQKAKNKSIDKAGSLAGREANVRVVMPNLAAKAVQSALGVQPMPALVYNPEKEASESQMNWHQIEDLSHSIASMISETAQQFQTTIQMVQNIGHVEDMARFTANVKVTMEDLEKFTEEYIKVKAKHEGKTGFITEAADRMAYLSVFEDYNALSAYFQGTMHHKLIEFTEYALNAKDKLLEAESKATETPAEEVQPIDQQPTTEV